MTQALPVSVESQALRLAARLASCLVRPIGHFDSTVCAMPPLLSESLAAMAAHPAFHRPLNRAVAQSLRPGMDAIDAACVARLRTSGRSRLAALLVCEPMPVVEEAAIRIAAATLHRRVIGLVLRTERERVRTAIGEPAFLIATQEAPVLYAPLASVEGDEAQSAALAAPDAARLRMQIIETGLRVLARFLEAVEPALRVAFDWRLPAPEGGPDRRARRTVLSNGHCDQVVRLLRRRMDAWSPIIA